MDGRPEQRAYGHAGLAGRVSTPERGRERDGSQRQLEVPVGATLRLAENNHLDTCTRTARTAAASEMEFG